MESMNTSDQQNGELVKLLKNKAAAISNRVPATMFSMEPIHTLNR
jgi:hypothetical protein